MLNIDYILVILTVIGTLFFIAQITFLRNWHKLRRYVKPYLKYGIGIALIIILPSLVDLYLSFKTLQLEEFVTTRIIISVMLSKTSGLLFSFFVLIAVTVVGLYYAYILNKPQLPILVPKLRASTYSSDDSPAHYQIKREKVSISHIDWIFAVLTIAVASAIIQGLLSGVNLYLEFPFTNNDELRSIMRNIESDRIHWVMSIIGGLIFVIYYEIFFRLGIQNALSVWWGKSELAQSLAIAMASLFHTSFLCGPLILFSTGHYAWLIFAQVFIVGLGLGWLNKRYGIEAAILASAITCLLYLSVGLFKPFIY